jgi:type IV pilus assembly protein PilA
MRGRRSNSGFTLVELIIVVALIGILILIGIPQYQSYRARSYNGNAIADLRNLRSGMEAFMSDRGSYPSLLEYR